VTNAPPRIIRGWDQLAARLGCSKVTAWRSVRDERLPPPAYLTERTPIWSEDEIAEAIARLTMKPQEAKAKFRAEKLARDKAAKDQQAPA
jgi:predicted DNA-binding transcriptional regulator AlpA